MSKPSENAGDCGAERLERISELEKSKVTESFKTTNIDSGAVNTHATGTPSPTYGSLIMMVKRLHLLPSDKK